MCEMFPALVWAGKSFWVGKSGTAKLRNVVVHGAPLSCVGLDLRRQFCVVVVVVLVVSIIHLGGV